MLSDFAEERPIDGKQADITFMHYVRRYALLGIRRGVLHGVLRHMCCAVRKQNPAANGSLIERAHIFPMRTVGSCQTKQKEGEYHHGAMLRLCWQNAISETIRPFFDVLHTEH